MGNDPESGQFILGGMGELHLDITRDRLEHEFNVVAVLVSLKFHIVKHLGKLLRIYHILIKNNLVVLVNC